MEQHFKRSQQSLDSIFAFVDDFISANKLKETIVFSLKLAIEELFTNLVRHNSGGRDRITISMDQNNAQIVIRLKDYDVEPFDISRVEKIDISKPLEERDIGGLGIHLVKSIVDKISYEYKDRTMCVTVIKNLEA